VGIGARGILRREGTVSCRIRGEKGGKKKINGNQKRLRLRSGSGVPVWGTIGAQALANKSKKTTENRTDSKKREKREVRLLLCGGKKQTSGREIEEKHQQDRSAGQTAIGEGGKGDEGRLA